MESLERRELFVVGTNVLAAVVAPGNGYDGVVQVAGPAGSCTGSLLSTGRHVLTAAHCVDFDADSDGDGASDTGNGTVDAGTYTITFNLSGRNVTIGNIPASNISVPPDWTGNFRNGDIAIIELTRLAPVDADRYEIYRDGNEVGSTVTLVGYGNSGRGSAITGQPAGHVRDGVKRLGRNMIDSVQNGYLVIDLDNPAGTGDVWREAITAPGDSGGPAFMRSQIVGVSSGSNLQPRFGATGGPSYGWTGNAYGASSDFTRVSDYADWIDRVLDQSYNLTVDLRDQPIGNDDLDDVTVLTLNRSNWHNEIHVNGTLYFSGDWAHVKSITVQGSKDRDYFKIDSPSLMTSVTINGGLGSDSLWGYSKSNNQWTINRADGGSLTNGLQTVAFQSVETLIGGDAADVFSFVGLWARISTAIYGGAGKDKLDYSQFGYGVNVNLEESRATAIGSRNSNRAVGFEDITGTRFDDVLVGNAAHNTIWGLEGKDRIWGRAGDDRLYGGGGDDELYGESGVDYLFGQDGNDFLDGGNDGVQDYLWGGSGRDTFVHHRRLVWGLYGYTWGSQDEIKDLTEIDSLIA